MIAVTCSKDEILGYDEVIEGTVYWVDNEVFDNKDVSTARLYRDYKGQDFVSEFPTLGIEGYESDIATDGIWWYVNKPEDDGDNVRLKDILAYCELNKYYDDDDDTRNILWYIQENGMIAEDNMKKYCRIKRMSYKYAEQNGLVAEFRKYQGYSVSFEGDTDD